MKIFSYAFFIGLFSVFLANSAVSDEPVKEIKALISALEKLSTSSPVLDEELADLKSQVDALLNPDLTAAKRKLLDIERLITKLDGDRSKDISAEVERLRLAVEAYQDEQLGAHILNLATSLNSALNTHRGRYPAATRQELMAVLRALERVEIADPVEAIGARASSLNTMITSQPRVMNGELLPDHLDTLRTTLATLQNHFYLAALAARGKEFKALLDKANTQPHRLRTTDLALLGQIHKKITTMLAARLTTGVHVVSARFGRTSGPGQAGASCGATATMRKLCQKQPKCGWPTIGAGAFCNGRDPAPFVPSQHKGVKVTFACLTGDDALWAAYAGRSGMRYSGPSRTVTLRSANDEIVCK